MQDTTLHLFCGKMASGKSTLASQLAARNRYILISEDQLLGALYPGKIMDVSTYVKFSTRLKAAIENHIIQLLRLDHSVALDFPANTVTQRQWLRDLARKGGATTKLHYLVCSDNLCKDRLRKRAAESPELRETDTLEMFEAISKYFEPPADEEDFNIIVYEHE